MHPSEHSVDVNKCQFVCMYMHFYVVLHIPRFAGGAELHH